MKRFVILATIIALVGCSQYSEECNNINAPEEKQIEFYASMPECDTRTYVEDNKYLRWNAGDEITVFAGNSYNSHWQFAGEDGANSGKFNELEDSGFVTGTPLDLTANYAIYPYDENITITEAGVVSLTLPAVQEYNHTYANSFGEGINTMIAVTKNTADNFLSFKNLCGYLKLKLYGDDVTVKSISVKGNNGEKIAGAATVTMAYGGEPTITMGDDASDTITIDCGEGVALSNDAANPTIFWVVIPETTFEGGITITVTDTNDQTFTKATTNAVPIENNLIQPMAALGVEVAPAGPANNEIWYTSSDGNIITPSATDVFGANIISNTYDVDKECWVITFDGVVTTIGDSAFYGCRSLTSITIPDSVTTIGETVFRWCSNLTSVTIGNSVTSIGDNAFYQCSSLASIIIPESVISIGLGAFSECSSLASVTIPDSVTSIGEYAFAYCDSLTEVHISDIAAWCKLNFSTLNNPLFYARNLYLNNELVIDLVIPDGVTSIGLGAFSECSSLESVTISDSVTSIGSCAFAECSSLMSVYCKPTTPPTGVYNMFDNNAEDRKIYVPHNSVKAYKSASDWRGYADYIVSSNYAPGEIVLETPAANNEIWYTATQKVEPYSITVFGANYVSNEWDSETGKGIITFDAPVTTIGKWAFDCRTSLTSVAIPNSVTSIDNTAFYYCHNIIAFYGKFASADNRCLIVDGVLKSFAPSGLTKYTIPNSVTSIGRYAFYACPNLKSVTIPDSVTSIEDNAFTNCSSLKSVTISDSVTSIGSYAFGGCSSLTSITIPDGVTSVGSQAFCRCSSLTSITIPDGVTSIGKEAFQDCSSLTSVYCKPTTPPTGVVYSTFQNNAKNRKIYVPRNSVNAYKSTSGWSSHSSYIVGYDFGDDEESGSGNDNDRGYIVVLNNAWRQSTSVSNPDSSLYYGVYESYSNYNVHSASAWMYIDIEGYDTFTIYVRSYAESNYDYVTVYNLDSTSSAKVTTNGNQQSGTSISNYTPVTFSNIGGGSHRIAIEYRKDGSQHSGADRGYVIIPKNQ